MKVVIDYKKCCWKDGKCLKCSCKGACTGCVEVCNQGALKRGNIVEIDLDKCTGCGLCVEACKHDAITLN
jgi:NAD-dependent dihydropyrimidine dehydrogenase PreA subunit